MNYELREDKILKLNELEEYTVENISALLNCCTKISSLIRSDIIRTYNLETKDTIYTTIPKKLLFEFISNNDELTETIRKDFTLCEILKKPFLNVYDIKILLNCNRKTAVKIISQIKTNMKNDCLPPLEEHILTKYFLKYIESQV